MNFLAHARLSFDEPGTLVGNMISDFVKGQKKFDYPLPIGIGITLHRLIDSYTDNHAATKEAKELFRPHYRLYSGAFVDVVYDHFLAIDPEEFSEDSLYDFSINVYKELDNSIDYLPPAFRQMLPYMKENNWLFNYRSAFGIGKSMAGLVRRATYLSDSTQAMALFEQHYQLFKDCYRHFWADVKSYARNEHERLKQTGAI